jgi:endogenous inhibitor of DNA gyrase (YacG/DUF329 family)
MEKVKLCECGCGLPAPISKRTEKKRGYVKGQPMKFIAGHNIAKPVKNVVMECEYCGKEKELYPSDAKRFRFCSRKCQGHYTRELTTCPDGTKRIDYYGYVLVKLADHPNSKNGWVKEHRLVMSEHLGRTILENEHIHHINGDKTDNRIDNLEILSPEEHAKLHLSDRQKRLNELKLWEQRERDEKGRFT